MVITIIGGGATALAFIYNYLELVGEKESPTTIYLVEKRGVFGPGAAYTADTSSNLLNTKAGYITPFYDKPGDFFNWLNANKKLWRRRFPEFVLDEQTYASRPLFGMYLGAKMAWLVKQAVAKNVRIIQIDAEAKDVYRVGNSYVTKTDCSLSLTSEFVFFFCGTLPAKPSIFASRTDRILSNPYPITDLQHKISRESSVAIMGARLSCIDAVIGLIEGGHQGKISIYSRSGYFPSVRGKQGRITPQLLTADNIDRLVRLKGTLRLANLVELVMQEISLVSDNVILDGFRVPLPPTDLEEYLTEEIELSQGARAWQAVLYSTNAIIDKLWAALADEDKAEFLDRYFSAFMSYRVSIPVENAEKILSYLKTGQLSFHGGDFDICLGEDERPAVLVKRDANPNPVAFDYLIQATGSPRAATELDSDLIDSLLHRGVVTSHRFGGIVVDPLTYQIVDTEGVPNRSLYAIGELTTGTFFFTSALDINARHARNCAKRFYEMIRPEVKESTPKNPETLALAG